jgi:hypothetical protein
MTIQLSPGVNISEIDATTVIPSVDTTTGAYAARFVWGPCNLATVVDSEITLAKKFGAPDSNTYISFFTASSFLAYANDLRLVRAVNANTLNADANSVANSVNVQIPNKDTYTVNFYGVNQANKYGPFIARYPGAFGNSIQVQVCDSANVAAFSTWTYANLFNGAPGTSTYAFNAGAADDEFHIVVIDAGGLFTGTKGTVLEVYPFVSKAFDAVDGNGTSTYWKNVLYTNSQYVYGVDSPDYANTNATWGLTAGAVASGNVVFGVVSSASTGYVSYQFTGGVDSPVTDADIENAYGYFTNPDTIDISLVLTGGHDVTVQQWVIDNIVTPAGSLTGRRGDSLAFLSPPSSAVVNQRGSETTNILAWLTSLSRSTSYAVVDSGWKYMFDKYNNVSRYVPLNGDIAGLCVYTDSILDPWWSPAGFNRGAIKNVVKLAWNPDLTARNILYPQGVNPVVSIPGNGTLLYGDKTLQAKPSAFDRINVRRLFIDLEKSISLAAKYSLFEFNDQFTQAQFVALVSPYLRDVQGRRGITDFRVVCDGTNNTPQIVDTNKFVGDIYIKPARSINWIQLNFIAVGTGVTFSEVTGAV